MYLSRNKCKVSLAQLVTTEGQNQAAGANIRVILNRLLINLVELQSLQRQFLFFTGYQKAIISGRSGC
jgi:hypothetical protein